MPKARTLEIYNAIKKTNKLAAKEYLDMAHYREGIDEAALKVAMGIIEKANDNA